MVLRQNPNSLYFRVYEGHALNLLGREEDYVIPFDCVNRIGDDIILAEVQGDYRREKCPRRPFM